MIYKTSEIQRDVRIAIDENQVDGRLILENDSDSMTLNEIIRSKIEEGARQVIEEVPHFLLGECKHLRSGIFWKGEGMGYLLLPDDFFRLLVFRMSDWEKPVTEQEVINDNHPNYQLQHSRCRGVRGNPQKPIVAIVRRSDGLRLEFYSCRNNEAEVENGLYVPYPRIDQNGGIEIPEKCYKGIIYAIASLVLATYRDNGTRIMQALSKRALMMKGATEEERRIMNDEQEQGG